MVSRGYRLSFLLQAGAGALLSVALGIVAVLLVSGAGDAHHWVDWRDVCKRLLASSTEQLDGAQSADPKRCASQARILAAALACVGFAASLPLSWYTMKLVSAIAAYHATVNAPLGVGEASASHYGSFVGAGMRGGPPVASGRRRAVQGEPDHL